MPRPRSKREVASDHIEEAISHASQALSKLGGYVRRKPKDPLDNQFIARQYLESVISRLNVIQALLRPTETLERVMNAVSANPKLLDDFEREYDSTRNPGC